MFNIGRLEHHEGTVVSRPPQHEAVYLCSINREIEQLVQPSVFEPPGPATSATLLFVAVFSGSLTDHPDRPISIEVAVPDSELREWLFSEPLSTFVRRYNAATSQPDNVVPVLKPATKKKSNNDNSGRRDDTGNQWISEGSDSRRSCCLRRLNCSRRNWSVFRRPPSANGSRESSWSPGA